MVSDLKYESHPGKLLEEHIRGVQNGTLLRSSLSIAEMAAIFHDMGKINPNFQNKLYGKGTGYSNHSYLSVIAFVNYVLANTNDLIISSDFKQREDILLFTLQISVLIAKHHQNLPDFEGFSESEELGRAIDFINNNKQLPISDFYITHFNSKAKAFELTWSNQKEKLLFFPSKTKRLWKQDSLKHFFDTQEAFSALIEADKRDAGKNNTYIFEELLQNNIAQLAVNLDQTFTKFKQNGDDSDLNKLRTEIRLEAIENINKKLSNKERVFTLTAPTGAGKTFTLLSIANKIRQEKGNLGIIYALPFLSITEQVKGIAESLVDDILSVNSKAENTRISDAQASYEENQSEENLKEILKEDFVQNTFDHPFIITTFVQFFETLVSNKNSTLLKLPNFRDRIFLIDEIQALPPRLYIFFTAWLDEFCRRNNSYAILSSATMPNVEIPIKKVDDDCRADLLFSNYSTPNELIDCKKYFNANIFNRYTIRVIAEKQTTESLAEHILERNKSCLVILNTIADTKNLYNELKSEDNNVLLLNTYFIPDDRISIIAKAQILLKENEKVILISTQLIEAGVDIDFPVVYRDMCPLPSLIQSAGRCNRNNKIDKGQVYFFELVNESGQSRANLIYKDEGKKFLDFCKDNIKEEISENKLFNVQQDFFNFIQNNLTIGEFGGVNMIECVNKAKFETLGKFRLINNDIGEQAQYYVLKDDNDNVAEILDKLINKLKPTDNYTVAKKIKIDINTVMKKMSGRMLNIRINKYNKDQMPQVYRNEIMGINFIDTSYYSSNEGLLVNNIENCFL